MKGYDGHYTNKSLFKVTFTDVINSNQLVFNGSFIQEKVTGRVCKYYVEEEAIEISNKI